MTQPSELSRERVLITGASRGIGRAIADLYASRGAQVLSADLDPIPELQGGAPVQSDVASAQGRAQIAQAARQFEAASAPSAPSGRRLAQTSFLRRLR